VDAVNDLRDRLRGRFAEDSHWELFRFVVALTLPWWLGPIRLFLAAPFIVRVSDRLTKRRT
jgi:hypothetical protein